MNTRNEYDAIIVGAGRNGLVTAAYLAKAGLKVLVLERRHMVGGACVTEEPWPGFKVSTAAYALSLLRPEIIQDLALTRFGLEFHAKDPQYFVPFPDGKHLFLWRDPGKTIKEIERFSRNDAKAYPDFVNFWERFAKTMDATVLTRPPAISDLSDRFMRFGGKDDFRKVMFLSAKELLDEYFESDYVKAALATQGIIGARAGPMSPGTAFIFGYHYLGLVNGRRGIWAYVKGGMGKVTEAMAKSAQSLGVVIKTNSEVDRILIQDGAAIGVVLTRGEKIHGRVIISNADPKRTFLKLVGPENLDPGFVRKVEHIKTEGVSMKVLLAVKELPDFLAYPGRAVGPQHTGTMGIAPSVEYLEKAWDDAKHGRPSEEPFMEAFIQSTVDPSLVPPGRHCISIFAQYAPYSLKSGSWDDVREEYGDRIVDTLCKYAPNLRAAILHREVLTPLDLERRFYLTDGNIFHAEMSLDQIGSFRPVPGWAEYRTPIKNLYLCGSGTHPGGGVSGAPGYNAAKAVLHDIRGQ